MPESPRPPSHRGLVFFPPGTPPRRRRRRQVFAVIWVAASLAMIWPVLAWIPSPFPLVLGLPTPIAWIAGWLFVVLGALAWLYRTEDEPADV